MAVSRRWWTWHLWLGLGLALPILWWLATALVFVAWPMDEVRGRHLAGAPAAVQAPLPLSLALPPELLDGHAVLTLRRIEGHLAAVALGPGGHGAATQVWDLDAGMAVGPVIPAAWAEAAARRGVRGAPAPTAGLLLAGEGPAQVLTGTPKDLAAAATEYPGPFPAYAFHFEVESLHVYVDALTGEVRQRRTARWRFYDLAFRLHALEMVPEGLRRPLMALVALTGLLTAATGAVLGWKRLRRRG